MDRGYEKARQKAASTGVVPNAQGLTPGEFRGAMAGKQEFDARIGSTGTQVGTGPDFGIRRRWRLLLGLIVGLVGLAMFPSNPVWGFLVGAILGYWLEGLFMLVLFGIVLYIFLG